MQTSEYALRQLKTFEEQTVTPEQLYFIAYNSDYNTVYSVMAQIPTGQRINYSNKYILFETITGSIKRLSDLKNRYEELLIKKEKKFLLEILDLFISESALTSN